MAKMKRGFCTWILVIGFLRLHSQGLDAMTFNIRYDNQGDKENWWDHRNAEVVEMIRYYSPDILGIQEGLHHQVVFLDSALAAYEYVGVGRDDGMTKGEYAAIFYKKDRMQLLSTQTFWLSETPEKVSVGWDASMERITTFAMFKDLETEETLSLFNCHFDHRGKESRLNAAKLILRMIEEKDLIDERLIVMGDLNCLPIDPPILTLSKYFNDPYLDDNVATYGPLGTWNGFDNELLIENRIDYILTKNLDAEVYVHIDDRRQNNLFLSDHLPVLLKMKGFDGVEKK